MITHDDWSGIEAYAFAVHYDHSEEVQKQLHYLVGSTHPVSQLLKQWRTIALGDYLIVTYQGYWGNRTTISTATEMDLEKVVTQAVFEVTGRTPLWLFGLHPDDVRVEDAFKAADPHRRWNFKSYVAAAAERSIDLGEDDPANLARSVAEKLAADVKPA